MRILAVTNLKGGVSKTTVAANLANELGAYLLDADSQGAASTWLGVGTLGVKGQALPLPFNASDATIDRWGETITTLDADLVVIDCPPTLGITTHAAMLLADLVLIPTGASALDLQACQVTLEYLNRAREQRNGKPAALLVPAKCDLRTSAGRELSDALSGLDEPVTPMLGLRVAFVDSATLGLSVCQYAPKSQACQEIKNLTRTVKRALKGV